MGTNEMPDLTEEQMIDVLTGKTTVEDVLSAAAAPAEPVTPPEPAEPATAEPAEPEPVIVSRDGKHTIPYSRLEEVQDEAAALREQNRLLAEQLQAAQQAKTPPAEPSEEVPSLEEAYPEVAAYVAKLVGAKLDPLQQQVAETLAPVKEATAKTAQEAHDAAIRAVFSDFDAIRKDPAPLNDWISKQPPLARMGYEFARDQGSTEQVVQLFTEFAKSVQPPAAPPAPGPDAAALAAAKVAEAKAAPPVSLTDVPGATAAAHDSTAALLDMSPTELMRKFSAGQGAQQIMELLDRVV